MKIVTLTTYLNAPADRIWDEVKKPRLLMFVAHPVLRFKPVDPVKLPDQWEDGDYVFDLKWHGVVPLGKQVISISRPAAEGDLKLLRDNGHSALIKRWDHLISVKPEDDGTRYTDRIEIEAGVITPIVTSFARRFYSHRQRRWQRLVTSDFDYAKA